MEEPAQLPLLFTPVGVDCRRCFSACTSDFHYVEQIYSGAYNSTEIASPDGIPLRMQSTSIEMAYEIPISLVKAVTDVHVEGLEDADPDGLVLNAYIRRCFSGRCSTAGTLRCFRPIACGRNFARLRRSFIKKYGKEKN